MPFTQLEMYIFDREATIWDLYDNNWVELEESSSYQRWNRDLGVW
jgi:hypothetical protein